jgi:hypothetical protein
LSEESAKRLREYHGQNWHRPSIAVDDETLTYFNQLHGDLIPHVLPSLVGLSAEDVLNLGGIRVVGEDGTKIKEWPPR